jgi:hypothetical protein
MYDILDRRPVMILSKLQNSPAKMVPVAMMLLTVGLMFLVIGIVWPKLSFPVAHFGLDLNDFVRGMTFGIATALEIGGVVLAMTAAAARTKKL